MSDPQEQPKRTRPTWRLATLWVLTSALGLLVLLSATLGPVTAPRLDSRGLKLALLELSQFHREITAMYRAIRYLPNTDDPDIKAGQALLYTLYLPRALSLLVATAYANRGVLLFVAVLVACVFAVATLGTAVGLLWLVRRRASVIPSGVSPDRFALVCPQEPP